MSDRPLSELYRLAAEEHADLDAAAAMLEEMKTATLSQWKLEYGDIADNKAEKLVKASEKWRAYIRDMIEARRKANRAKAQMEYWRIKHWERQSLEANARAERRM